ncbi:NADH-quinone oxidoreductase subunit NuoF [Phosphitispora fastidiosa]|uniref:NADH-quinone oxidoreductase subunit NuoF n=1 Tax=Phosphitispora fastidiosa TaxID=2837202 RepID=UPI001E29107C|nr:NADP-reducing hydrogenase subunit HndC [Phosphitispora fastidiosa]
MSHSSHILICRGTACVSAESREVQTEFEKQLKQMGLLEQVRVVHTGCFGFCARGPVMVILPQGTMYCEVRVEDVGEIIEKHILEGQTVERLLFKDPVTQEVTEKIDDIEFFKKQVRIALRNCGHINPDDIREYIARDGYKSLGTALTEHSPEEVINIIKKSGLRGRGGGGFPTGLKWELARKSPGKLKYVICNADEGDPGAFMDRSILEGDPHSVLEAMAIAGYAIGASQGFVYVRAEYAIAVQRLTTAISQAREMGLLGRGLFETDFGFDIELRLGAGAFVCGEETALITSIEGNRGEPRPKPPFPAQAGLWGKPTLINNVETLANIPAIILNGAEWYTGFGTEKSKGTKVFAIAGKIGNTGLIEVPMGITLREIIYDIGGGIPGGRKFKAAQTGGPSGGCIPAGLLDTSIEYDTLLEVGSMMGSGGLIVMDDNDCMVDIAKFYLEFTCDESCGKCTPCRVGTKRMLEILERITEGRGTVDDIDLLKELGHGIKEASLCGLGQSAPNPVLSTLKYFEDEYIAHVRDKICPAGVCKKLSSIRIDPDECKKCGACAKVCPVDAIRGKPREIHEIDPDKCIKCGQCLEKCCFQAIKR